MSQDLLELLTAEEEVILEPAEQAKPKATTGKRQPKAPLPEQAITFVPWLDDLEVMQAAQEQAKQQAKQARRKAKQAEVLVAGGESSFAAAGTDKGNCHVNDSAHSNTSAYSNYSAHSNYSAYSNYNQAHSKQVTPTTLVGLGAALDTTAQDLQALVEATDPVVEARATGMATSTNAIASVAACSAQAKPQTLAELAKAIQLADPYGLDLPKFVANRSVEKQLSEFNKASKSLKQTKSYRLTGQAQPSFDLQASSGNKAAAKAPSSKMLVSASPLAATANASSQATARKAPAQPAPAEVETIAPLYQEPKKPHQASLEQVPVLKAHQELAAAASSPDTVTALTAQQQGFALLKNLTQKATLLKGQAQNEFAQPEKEGKLTAEEQAKFVKKSAVHVVNLVEKRSKS